VHTHYLNNKADVPDAVRVVAGWGQLIDPTNPSLGYNGFAMIARDGASEWGSCAITSDGGYLYK